VEHLTPGPTFGQSIPTRPGRPLSTYALWKENASLITAAVRDQRMPADGPLDPRADAADGIAVSIEVDPSSSLDPTFGAVASSEDAELGLVRPTAHGIVRRAVLLRDPIPVLGMYQRGEQGRIGKAISR